MTSIIKKHTEYLKLNDLYKKAWNDRTKIKRDIEEELTLLQVKPKEQRTFYCEGCES